MVGGHSIGVDPFYLTHKAEEIGYHPQVILAGRRINDSMGKYIAETTVKQLIRADKAVKGARVLVLGLTFKENVPDIRNTKVIDIVKELQDFQVEVMVHDPVTDAAEAEHEYGIELQSLEEIGPVDGVVLAVAHDAFAGMSCAQFRQLCSNGNNHGVVIDIKAALNGDDVAATGLSYWAL